MASHLGMALEAILYSRFYTYHRQHLMLVGGWTLINDGVDYLLDLHPWLPASIAHMDGTIGVFTLGLSFISLSLFAALGLQPPGGAEMGFPDDRDLTSEERAVPGGGILTIDAPIRTIRKDGFFLY